MNVTTRGGRPPARVTWEYEDGTKVTVNDIRAKARLFDALLGSLDSQGLRQLEQSISELRISRIDREQTARSLEERRAAIKAHQEAQKDPIAAGEAPTGVLSPMLATGDKLAEPLKAAEDHV